MKSSPDATKPALELDVKLPPKESKAIDMPEKDPGLMDLSLFELERRNLALREKLENGESVEKEVIAALRQAHDVTEVTLYFSDLEGKAHSISYDRRYILDSMDNLTFDGSSINGFTSLGHSDLRLKPDWNSFRWLPAQEFGAGKVLAFANICDQDGSPYEGDFRGRLAADLEKLKEKGIKMNLAPETEGMLVKGANAEQEYDERIGLEPATIGGYMNSLPKGLLKRYTDRLAKVTRALGFRNEKDHPEVAPGQFEINWRFRHALYAADQILIQKIVAKQIAVDMSEKLKEPITATFLPKPIAGINGNGNHSNISFEKDGENLFYDPNGPDQLSEMALLFAAGVLSRAEICLVLNPSVGAYRRLDPKFEAPNAVKMSASDRGSMIRVPIGNEKSARIEVRTVAPDVNPYLAYTLILAAGQEGIESTGKRREEIMELLSNDREIEVLPGTIQDAIEVFKDSEFAARVMGDDNKRKFTELKEMVADRSPKALGTIVKTREIRDHHEVRNQVVDKDF